MKKYFSLFLFFALNFYFSQQTEGLRIIKAKYDIQIQNIENSYADALTKALSRKRVNKITLIKDKEINALKFQRNNEYLEELAKINAAYTSSHSGSKIDKNIENATAPKHPNGSDFFKKEMSDNFFADAIKGTNRVECRVYFIIEKDGSITSVKASGSNEQFNRQAELCVLLTQEKWKPATRNGQPERAFMNVPLALNFD
jgi:hypothetical protein